MKESLHLQPISVGATVAAQLLGISERNLATHTANGTVPHFRLGSRVLYSVEALREWAVEQSRRCGLDATAEVANNAAEKEAA